MEYFREVSMKYIRIMLLLILCMLAACSQEPSIKKGHLVNITAQAYANTLFYSGSIQPLTTQVITSPVDGVVVDMPFQYGEEVKPNQLLFKISSEKFLSDYKVALMQYIKAKNDFNSSQTQRTEAIFLHKHELISDDDYKTKQSNFYASQLALLQAKDVLENLLKQLDKTNARLYQLTIEDVDKITQAMHLQKNSENLQILAPRIGIVLSPNKNEDEIKKIIKGDAIKQGDVLAVIGDMSGISVKIKVNELTVNQLRIGQKVNVTGIAFPGELLHGEIIRVDRQGEINNGGLPIFSVEIIVPKLSVEQQKIIHVGMSAKVEIVMEEIPQIMIPIAAVQEKNGSFYVKKYNNKNKNIDEVAIKTGKTTLNAIIVLAGLNAGDNIVIPD